MIYLTLFWEFFKIGLFAVGGGLAALPFLYDLTAKYPWFSASQLTDMIAIAESTPGPLGINMATYAGFASAGLLGGLVATVAMVLPSFLITLLICRFFTAFQDNLWVKQVFWGLRPAVAGLIAAVTWSLIEIAVFHSGSGPILARLNIPAFCLFAVLLPLILRFKLHPVVYIALGAGAGIILGL